MAANYHHEAPIIEAILDTSVDRVSGISAVAIAEKMGQIKEKFFASPNSYTLVDSFSEAEFVLTVERFTDLARLGNNWNGYDVLAPKADSLSYALSWCGKFCQEIAIRGSRWLAPHVTADGGGEVVLEWWRGEKKLTIYFASSNTAEYLMSWGSDINTDMTEGEANTPAQRLKLWQWLMR